MSKPECKNINYLKKNKPLEKFIFVYHNIN